MSTFCHHLHILVNICINTDVVTTHTTTNANDYIMYIFYSLSSVSSFA